MVPRSYPCKFVAKWDTVRAVDAQTGEVSRKAMLTYVLARIAQGIKGHPYITHVHWQRREREDGVQVPDVLVGPTPPGPDYEHAYTMFMKQRTIYVHLKSPRE